MKLLYHMPTKVIMGDGCVRSGAALLGGMGTRALIVTGARSARLCGALDDVAAALDSNGQAYAIFDRVMCNPTVACVYEGAAAAKRHGADFVVAIGGGSPMDAAKAVALLARQDIPGEALFSSPYSADVLPMAHVPTTAGTGAEVTPYAVLTNDALQTKKSISSPAFFPRYAFLDARYTKGLSRAITVNTAIDALTHAAEGMLTVHASAVTDVLAAESMRRISACFAALEEGALTDAQREQLLYGSMVAGIVIANTGTTMLHALGYPLTYFRDIDHGRANGLLMAAFFDFLNKHVPQRIGQILEIMGFSRVDQLRAVLDRLLGEKEPVGLEEAQKFTGIAAQSKNNASMIAPLRPEDMCCVYRRSFGL